MLLSLWQGLLTQSQEAKRGKLLARLQALLLHSRYSLSAYLYGKTRHNGSQLL